MDARRKRTVRAVYWGLSRQGFEEPVIGNLAAIEFGIEPCRTSWTEAQLRYLLWTRWLVRHGKTVN